METGKDLQRLKCVWLIQLPQWASEGLWGKKWGMIWNTTQNCPTQGVRELEYVYTSFYNSHLLTSVLAFISSLTLLIYQAWAVLAPQTDVETGGLCRTHRKVPWIWVECQLSLPQSPFSLLTDLFLFIWWFTVQPVQQIFHDPSLKKKKSPRRVASAEFHDINSPFHWGCRGFTRSWQGPAH